MRRAFVVAPEPAPWLRPLVEDLSSEFDVRVFAPWAMPSLGTLSERVGFWSRRVFEGPVTTLQPAWLAVDAVASWAARTRVERQMWVRVLTRSAVARLAARLVQADDLVVAPSLTARTPFARSTISRCLLIEDLPDIRSMHRQLDLASARWPECGFLRRFRAPHAWVAQQEAERIQAGLIVARSAVGAERAGRTVVQLRQLKVGEVRRSTTSPVSLLLAGVASARHGVMEALEVQRRLGAQLLVRVGPGSEPVDLLSRPGVRASTEAERKSLTGVSVVLAPAWCEAELSEVSRAAHLGVPVVGTRFGSGLFQLGHEVAPGDVEGLIDAVHVALARPKSVQATPWPTLREALSGSSSGARALASAG